VRPKTSILRRKVAKPRGFVIALRQRARLFRS
jgi:hypothetical protein